MYRINPLMRNVLISPDEVLFHGPTNHTFDIRNIESAIIIAEERFISPALGYDMYQALIAQKNLVITAGNIAAQQTLFDASQATGAQSYTLKEGDIINAFEYMNAENLSLWKMHLWKLVAECVLLIATPDGFVQFSSEGVIHKNPQSGPMIQTGAVTPDLRSVKWVMDKKMQDRIDPLREAMHMWLCKQKEADSSKYELYEKYCDCNADGVPFKRKTDLVLGIYDDEDEECSCE